MSSRYRNVCSCCSAYIIAKEFPDGIRPEDNKEAEGNLCSQCYGEAQLRNWFECKDMRDQVSEAMNPLNSFKFNSYDPEYQTYICFKMMDKGIISFNVTR